MDWTILCDHGYPHSKDAHKCDQCCMRDDYPGNEVNWAKSPGPQDYKTTKFEPFLGLQDEVNIPAGFVLIVFPDGRVAGLRPDAMTMATIQMVRDGRGSRTNGTEVFQLLEAHDKLIRESIELQDPDFE